MVKLALPANPTLIPVKVGNKVGDTETPPNGGVVQTDEKDAEKVPHADELCPYEEASDSNDSASTLAIYSSYSGYSTDDLE